MIHPVRVTQALTYLVPFTSPAHNAACYPEVDLNWRITVRGGGAIASIFVHLIGRVVAREKETATSQMRKDGALLGKPL